MLETTGSPLVTLASLLVIFKASWTALALGGRALAYLAQRVKTKGRWPSPQNRTGRVGPWVTRGKMSLSERNGS
jgi:hypothetical protein